MPFRKFAAQGSSPGSALARETLAELPGQIVNYFMRRGVAPPPPLLAVPVPLPPLPADMAVPVALPLSSSVRV